MAAQRGDADRIFTELMSPFCPGLTLADCPSPNAFELRKEIRARLEAGEDWRVIQAELVQQYGVQILSDPTGTPIGNVVWGVPFGAAALAALGLAWFVRRAARVAAVEGPAAALDADAARRLDEELNALD